MLNTDQRVSILRIVEQAQYAPLSLSTAIKLKTITQQLLSDNESMARHRRLTDVDESTRATMESLSLALAQKDIEIKELRAQHTNATSNNALSNLELDTLHYVWCDGGCSGGTHQYDDEKVSEDIVLAAERNTRRLRAWYENAEFKRRNYKPPTQTSFLS